MEIDPSYDGKHTFEEDTFLGGLRDYIGRNPLKTVATVAIVALAAGYMARASQDIGRFCFEADYGWEACHPNTPGSGDDMEMLESVMFQWDKGRVTPTPGPDGTLSKVTAVGAEPNW